MAFAYSDNWPRVSLAPKPSRSREAFFALEAVSSKGRSAKGSSEGAHLISIKLSMSLTRHVSFPCLEYKDPSGLMQ